MSSLRSAVCAYYESQQLRPAVVERLLAHAIDRRRRAGVWRRAWAPVGAVAAFLFAGLLMRHLGEVDVQRADALARTVAAEISLNHHKHLDPEFRSEDITELGTSMDRLGFTLVLPARVAESGARLVGARYCSLRGQPAAQVQLRDRGGRKHTLYEVPPAGDLDQVKSGSIEIDGLGVTLWREKGLLFGWAEPLE